MERLDSGFLEKLILKGITTDKAFLVTICGVYEPEFFDDPYIRKAFTFSKDYINEYKEIPEKAILLNSMDDSVREGVSRIFDETESIEFDMARDKDYLMEQSNIYLKEQAIKTAIVSSVDVIEKNEDIGQIRNKIEEALCKDLKIDLGLDYFGQLGERLRRIFTTSDIRVPTYFPQFDEFISGGFPPFTLSVMVARIHGWKSTTLANFAARQVLHGHNVAILSLEMAQDEFAKRFDSIYSLLDINRIYTSDDMKRRLARKLSDIKSSEGRGELFIKQFPTGAASVNDFKIYLRELLMRGIKLSILFVDYINLMKSALKKFDGNMYLTVKGISEELRALSFEFEIPVVSVSQLNRDGGFVGFEELSFNYIAESMGLPATADFMSIYGTNEDELIYKSELHYKIVKNRLGGRVGEIDKFYFDEKSLKMYDTTEIDMWLEDASHSGDERNMATERPERQTNNRGRRRN